MRSCHNCGATGDKFHFARECQLPPRARANYVADAGAAGPPAGAVGHSALSLPGASEPVARRTFASCVARTSLPVFSAPSVDCANPVAVSNRYASLFMMRAKSPTHVDGSTVVRVRGDPAVRRPHFAEPVIDIDDEILCGLCESSVEEEIPSESVELCEFPLLGCSVACVDKCSSFGSHRRMPKRAPQKARCLSRKLWPSTRWVGL